MSWTDELAERVRTGAPIPFPVSALLTAATPVTRVGMWARKQRRPTKVGAHVISVGNLTAGGTGKTPAVLWHLECHNESTEHRAAVLTRGYGTPSESPLTFSDDVAPTDYCSVLGDEPALILQKYPDTLVIKGKDRVRSAQAAIERYGCSTLILDDGFQYVRLERDVNWVLIDATNPFGNGRLVPRGILREPQRALNRATDIVITRCDLADADALAESIRMIAPQVPIRNMAQQLGPLRRLCDGEQLDVEHFGDWEVDIACGIGNPDAFARSVERSCKVRVVQKHVFRDHAVWDPNKLSGNRVVITTEKDAVRLADPPDNLYALEMKLVELPD
jgi:tetraacyldisaccharide 4'-kinase